MNILVCVKQVPKDEDLKLDPETKTLIRSQGTGVISEYDKYAMELAARLKAEAGGKVTAITMGPPASVEVLRYCLSVGADDVYLLSDRAMGGADAYATVNVLAAAKTYLEGKSAPYHLVLCGKQASDSDTSLVMPELAEALNCPQVTFAVDYELVEGSLRVRRETDDGIDVIEVPFPAVISVGKTVFPARYPNIRLKLKANHTEIPILSADILGIDHSEIGVKGSKTTVGDSYFPEHNKSCVNVSGESGKEKAESLVSLLRSARMI
ncbi:MAG: electron transfer flavoprotein subunit beta/FixA family protein [Candidatus Onthomonas sp.]